MKCAKVRVRVIIDHVQVPTTPGPFGIMFCASNAPGNVIAIRMRREREKEVIRGRGRILPSGHVA